MTGSIRTFDKEDTNHLPVLMEECVKEITNKNQTQYKINFHEISRHAVINNPTCARFFKKVAEDFYGEGSVTDKGTPSFGSEDFADYLDEIPGCFFWRILRRVTNDCLLHTSKFNFDDTVIEDVGELYCRLVIERLNIENLDGF